MAKKQKIFTIPFTLLLFVLNDASNAQCKSDLEKENIKGRIKEITETALYIKDGESKINHIKITKYDKEGKALNYSFASKMNDLKPKEILFKFDQAGNKTREIRYDLTGKVENYLTYEIDTNGNVIKSNYFNSDHRLIHYSTFRYNQTCDIIEAKYINADGTIWLWYESKYRKGLHTETLSLFDSTISKFSYDNHNNVSEYTENDKFSKKQKTHTYTYEYDDKSNWLKKSTYVDGEIHWIDKRKLIYYD